MHRLFWCHVKTILTGDNDMVQGAVFSCATSGLVLIFWDRGYENQAQEKNPSQARPVDPRRPRYVLQVLTSRVGLFELIMAMVNQSNMRHRRVIYITSRGMWMFLFMFPLSGHRGTRGHILSSDSYGTDRVVVTLSLKLNGIFDAEKTALSSESGWIVKTK